MGRMGHTRAPGNTSQSGLNVQHRRIASQFLEQSKPFFLSSEDGSTEDRRYLTSFPRSVAISDRRPVFTSRLTLHAGHVSAPFPFALHRA